MPDINIFDNSEIVMERKVPNKIVSWITILFSLLIMAVIVMCFYSYNRHLNYLGIIKKEDNIFIKVYVNKSDISRLENQELLVNNTKTNYEIDNVSNTQINTNQGESQYEVTIKLLDSKFKDNEVVDLNFKLNKTTFLKELIYLLKKG